MFEGFCMHVREGTHAQRYPLPYIKKATAPEGTIAFWGLL
jgi:hypothetical protein